MSILDSKFVKELSAVTALMYDKGWDERNGGNITVRIDAAEVENHLDTNNVLRVLPLAFDASKLAGEYFLVTGSGKYFKNVIDAPAENLGVIRVSSDGRSLDLLWGLENGAVPTSELPSHFMCHIARLAVDPEHRVVMHSHATHLLAMTFSHSLDERDFTRTLWQMCTECLVVFPDGVSIVPWLIPGTLEIGEATSAKMSANRLVIWPQHGIYGAGRDLDETFGLIETAEKAAEVYTYVQAQGGVRQTISDEDLQALADAFGVVAVPGYLNV
ncbi:MAG: rhamnulose-1-phosphate aldolase [Lactobacillales bacterium]|jgi:rhamnulose-1-phosphate aldolase|nr:rhamnulose-1-phosphate aldolase [Lactobacillales bacterium]